MPRRRQSPAGRGSLGGLPEGRAVLTEISEISGGRERLNVLDVFSDRPRSARMTSLLPWLFTISVILLLLEIAGRRLSLWSKVGDLFEPVVSPEAQTDIAGAPARQGWSQGFFGQWRL